MSFRLLILLRLFTFHWFLERSRRKVCYQFTTPRKLLTTISACCYSLQGWNLCKTVTSFHEPHGRLNYGKSRMARVILMMTYPFRFPEKYHEKNVKASHAKADSDTELFIPVNWITFWHKNAGCSFSSMENRFQRQLIDLCRLLASINPKDRQNK